MKFSLIRKGRKILMSKEEKISTNEAYKDQQDYRYQYNCSLSNWACQYKKGSRIGTYHTSKKYNERLGYRTEFQRDRDDIVYSPSFRQLSYKRQMFSGHGGQSFFTRLTHTLIVAQIARSIARGLRLDEFLTEAIALGHDIGHSPYGHSGEDGINDFLDKTLFSRTLKVIGKDCIKQMTIKERIEKEHEIYTKETDQPSLYQSQNPQFDQLQKLFYCLPSDKHLFDHHKQGYRLLNYIDKEGRGLELTLHTLYGILRSSGKEKDYEEFNLNYENINNEFASYEAQVVRIADDVAWTHHDLGQDLKKTGKSSVDALREYGNGHDKDLLLPFEDIREFLQLGRGEICGRFITDVINFNKGKLIPKGFLKKNEEGGHTISMSPEMENYLECLKRLVVSQIHERDEIKSIALKSRNQITEICEYLFDDGKIKNHINKFWYQHKDLKELSELEKLRVICDFVSFMSDSDADDFNTLFMSPYRAPMTSSSYNPFSDIQ